MTRMDLSTFKNIDPTDSDAVGQAAFRGDHVATFHPTLSLLAKDTQRALSESLAKHVFPTSTPATAREDILTWLRVSPMVVFTEPVLRQFADAYAHAWYPQTWTA